MFTGIVEATGIVLKIDIQGTNKTFTLSSRIANELRIDQSLSHNGVCLTVVGLKDDTYQVTAVEETLKKSNLDLLKVGDSVNLERSMPSDYRFDGHIVQGHVDQTGICTDVQSLEGSWLFDFEFDHEAHRNITVEKGSICINGVSLTVFNCTKNSFRVTIIPYTFENTNFSEMKKGTVVNLEFDIVGKYIQKMFELGYDEYIKTQYEKVSD